MAPSFREDRVGKSLISDLLGGFQPSFLLPVVEISTDPCKNRKTDQDCRLHSASTDCKLNDRSFIFILKTKIERFVSVYTYSKTNSQANITSFLTFNALVKSPFIHPSSLTNAETMKSYVIFLELT